MLESKLMADLLDPVSTIHKDELISILLSAEKDDLTLAVHLFDENQLTLIINDGEAFVNALGTNEDGGSMASESLVFIQGCIEYFNLPQNQGV